ncbi:phage tail protein [Proteus mirabilis]|uniref:phage tail protein n=1 Tax=Proteus mirabilis TaxID=584 RepID=UPI0034E5BF2B
MTVSTELSHEEYVGNGVTTDFDFRFRIFESKHLIVVVADSEGNETTLKNGTDYTIVGAGSYHGGKVVLNKPLARGWKILLERDLPVVQETDLRNQGKFFAEVHEDAFDYLTMLIQKALGTFSLSLRKPTYLSNYYDAKGNRIANLAPPKFGSDSANKDYVDNSIKDIDSKTLRVKDKSVNALPNTEQRANKILAFDDNGQPITVLPESGSASDVLMELGKPRGSKLIGHNNSTVRDELDRLDSKIISLSGNTGFDKIGRFLNIDSLRECAPTNTGMIVYVVSAYSEAEDEHHYGGGHFQSFDNSASHVEDDGGIVIVPASGDIAWRRINFTAYDMCFWGVKPDGKTDNAEAITRATSYAKKNHVELVFPAGNVKSSEAFPMYSRMSVRGAGRESSFFSKTTNNKYIVDVSLQVDALLVMLPDVYNPAGHDMDTFCFKPKIEGITFQRDSLTVDNLCSYGMWGQKLAIPIIRDANFYGAYIGLYGEVWFLFEAKSVQCFGVIGRSYAGVSISKAVNGKYVSSGTSLNFDLVSVLGFANAFIIANMSYSSLRNCTGEYISRLNDEPGACVFNFINPYGVSMTACSSEGADATLIQVTVEDNISGSATLVVDSYQMVNDTNPAVPIRPFYVDSANAGVVNVTFIGGDIRTGSNNYLPPLASGSNCNIKAVGTSTNMWDVLYGATYKEL